MFRDTRDQIVDDLTMLHHFYARELGLIISRMRAVKGEEQPETNTERPLKELFRD